MLRGDRRTLFDSLLTGRALGGVVVSVLAGLGTIVLVYRRRYEPARFSAAVAVAAIVVGWALARWPTILPGLTVRQAAAGHDTLIWVVVCVLVGALILFPSLALLFRLALTGRFSAGVIPVTEQRTPSAAVVNAGLVARAAAACLLAGFGLLNIADAQWAHGVGIMCLLGFVLLGFRAIIFTAVGERSSEPADAFESPEALMNTRPAN